jgi:hypothetical protein
MRQQNVSHIDVQVISGMRRLEINQGILRSVNRDVINALWG